MLHVPFEIPDDGLCIMVMVMRLDKCFAKVSEEGFRENTKHEHLLFAQSLVSSGSA